jgi:NDP-sugar pyrophosphorylase family protein
MSSNDLAQSPVASVRAVILAGGKGTRLRPLTAVFPKPLVPLGEKPVIEILLRRLQAFGLRDVTLCTGYLAELIRAVCGDGSKFGLRIEYIHEEQPLGTAGPLALVPNLTDPFLVMNGDLLTTLDFGRMLDFHRREQADLTIGLYPREVRIDFGVIERDAQGQFQGYTEKPTYHFDVSMGVNILSLRTMRHVAPGQRLDMPELVVNVHQAGGRVCCHRESCQWLDIGRMDDYAQAQEEFCRNEASFLRNGT